MLCSCSDGFDADVIGSEGDEGQVFFPITVCLTDSAGGRNLLTDVHESMFELSPDTLVSAYCVRDCDGAIMTISDYRWLSDSALSEAPLLYLLWTDMKARLSTSQGDERDYTFFLNSPALWNGCSHQFRWTISFSHGRMYPVGCSVDGQPVVCIQRSSVYGTVNYIEIPKD